MSEIMALQHLNLSGGPIQPIAPLYNEALQFLLSKGRILFLQLPNLDGLRLEWPKHMIKVMETGSESWPQEVL